MNEVAAPGVLLDWDSTFWGVTVGRVNADVLTTDRWTEIDAWAQAHGVDCLYFLARLDDPKTVTVAQEAGFQLVDVRVEFARPAVEAERPTRIRPYEPADLETLRLIARTNHEITRFYADPHFPREQCSDFYDTWIVRSCEGWADAVLVGEIDGLVAGYVTCHVDTSSKRGSIGLIGVSGDARGKGLGTDLVLSVLDWCHGRGFAEVSVVTQGANVAAQRLFQFCGFRTVSMGLWFHRWYE